MDIQYATRDHGDGLPPLDGSDFTQQRGYGRPRGNLYPSGLSPATASIPMPISSSFSYHNAPPALPPPRFVPIDGQPFSEPESGRREVDDEELPAYMRRADKDEGYGSLFSSASSRSKHSAPLARFGVHHDRFQFRSTADAAYDNSLLKKLDVRRAIDNRSPPRNRGLSSSSRDPSHHNDRFSLLKPLSLPTRTKQPIALDSPSRLSEISAPSAVSPLSMQFGLSHHLSREAGDQDVPMPYRSQRTESMSIPDDTSQASGMDIDDADFSVEEPTRLQNFHIDGPLARGGDHLAVGQKRRASSPLREQPPSHNIQSCNDLFRRRDAPPRVTQAGSRLGVIPQGSECAATVADRSSPFTSNLSLIASSITSLTTSSTHSDRRSPGALSPGGLSPTDTGSCTSPYAASISLTASPGSLVSRTPHLRTLSIEQTHSLVSPRKVVIDNPKAGIAKIQGFFMCECCPKKPKKFDSAEELSTHEAEKQYECSFCGNRFKNKNEAERHQNSLHVRRHSWSCSALSGYDRAFHESTSQPGDADTCGYCGEEFTRSGHSMGRSSTRTATEHDWDERIRHLQDVHKFQECNSSKKFYRADHFRQHLKHSHAGTSGKWTNMLENACMLEEDPPLPAR